MQYLTNTLLLASLAISNVAAAPVADNSAIQARQDVSDSFHSGPPNTGGNGPKVAEADYTHPQPNHNRKERRPQNGAEDDAHHLEERSKLPFEPDFGHDKREAYIYTQKKKERRQVPDIEAREAYIYTQKKERRDNSNLQARNAYIYTQKERRDPAAYIYTQKERRAPADVEARNAYIYTQKERRDPADIEARNAYIYTQKERRAPVEARNAEVDYDGSHVTPGHRDEEMMDVGSA
ncbi:unnamed protein product [Zymoseptoria tritici ST99CH_3D7]|uniref:Uncharacterized protein n=1 Tax=Zymoseptoria tritici (strain ST99CH_3D7) TaxID=1276538 RepID=A0A1X7RXL9_ZYMT9|nr:unnamed protein product [Zymoseptoria tritici ST99CH_3D7]